MYLAWRDSFEVAKLLLDYGASPDAADRKNQTALHIAARKDSAKVAKILLDNCAKANVKDEEDMTPQDYARQKFSHSADPKDVLDMILNRDNLSQKCFE